MDFFFFVQLFVFTDGEVADTFTIIREVKLNSKKHRYEDRCAFFWDVDAANSSM